LKGLQGGFTLGRGFFAMLSLKMALLVVMAGLQIWMGVIWRRTGATETEAVNRARVGLSLQCALGAVAALLGLGLRAA
jgi:cytochrome c oxidase assembly factor CtaG